MALSRTIRDAIQGISGWATAMVGWDGSDVQILSLDSSGNLNSTARPADGTALTSAARTASVDSSDVINTHGKGLHLVIDVTSITLTPSITVTIQGKDVVSGKYYTVLASAAITTVSTTVLKVHPALTAAANLVANDLLPRTWRVSVVNADADSITYSVGYSVV
jgi:hypothetical protein